MMFFITLTFQELRKSNGLDLDRLNWGNYDLLVIDESHNFRMEEIIRRSRR
jgi:hypothetical protein